MATELEEDYEGDDFREIVEESVRESLIEEIEEEWGNLHHNASLGRYLPDFGNDYEAERFWEELNDYAYMAIEGLQQDIEHEFGVALNLYSYGRGGATIAPGEWMAKRGHGDFCGVIDLSYEEVEYLDTMLAVLRYINKQVKGFCEGIAEWWKETKELNEWNKEIEEHNEKL